MPYDLPCAVDTHQKMFSVPAAALPIGVGAAPSGFGFLQYNTHRIELRLQNVAAPGNFAWISTKENGFLDAFRINGGETILLEFPPRVPMFMWQSGAGAPDVRYFETVYDPLRSGVSPERGGGIRSNVQNP